MMHYKKRLEQTAGTTVRLIRKWDRPLRFAFTLILFVVFVQIVGVPFSGKKYRYREGDIARDQIIAWQDTRYLDPAKTAYKKSEVRRTISPVFSIETNALQQSLSVLSNVHLLVQQNSRLMLSELSRKVFEKYDVWISPPALSGLRRFSGMQAMFRYYSAALSVLYSYYYFDRPENFFQKFRDYGIMLRTVNGASTEYAPFGKRRTLFYPINESWFRTRVLASVPGIPGAVRPVISELLSKLALPNVRFDKEHTRLREAVILAKVEPVVRNLKKDEVVVRKGDRISASQLSMLNALNRSVKDWEIPNLIGLGMFVLLFLGLLFYHLKHNFGINIYSYGRKELILLFFLFLNLVLAIIASTFKTRYLHLPAGVFIPVAFSAMCLALLFGEQLAYFWTVLSAGLTLLVTRSDFMSFGIVLGSGIVSVYFVRNSIKRTDIWKAGFWAGLFSSVCLVSAAFLQQYSFDTLMNGAMLAFVNTLLSAVMVVGMIPLFESVLGIATRFKLLELADTNSPLLKRMLIEAPGTYTHSLIVGNLAESAAESIGGNPLLARVGGYYHDIGKMEQPGYFTENQPSGEKNKHTDLQPGVSRSILIAHVKRGRDLGKKAGLPKAVVDFIEQHHGTTLIRFFYLKALDKKQSNVSRDDFRYPGPRPQTKETAIVMLADSVEAASKTLKNPTPQRIKGMVNEIIQSKFLDGELNESSLTLSDLQKITDCFTKLTTSLFHVRVDYPDENYLIEAEKKNREF